MIADTFHLRDGDEALPDSSDNTARYANLIDFKLVPPGQIMSAAPRGHYLSIGVEPLHFDSGAEAQIIAVGCYRGPDGYNDAIPGWRVINISEMPMVHRSLQIESNVFSILLRRAVPGEGYGSRRYITEDISLGRSL